MSCVIAIDAGTTGIRSRAVHMDGRPGVSAYREFTQHFPQPGWVEHDADEIWAAVRATLAEVVAHVGRDDIAAIGITNQRETVLAWDRATGRPYGRARPSGISAPAPWSAWSTPTSRTSCSWRRTPGSRSSIR